MRKIITILALSLCLVSAKAQNSVEFSKQTHDFGTINESKGDVYCEFVIKNISSSPVVINKVRTSCGCVTTKYNRKPIFKQQADTLRITFDPRFRVGTLNKTISVYHSADPNPIVLSITGKVIP